MKRLSAILIGLALAVAATPVARADEAASRSAYSYVRETGGEVSVVSRYNGRVDARRNLPISSGDEIAVSDGGRAEVALADGNELFVGAATRARFVSLRDQQGEEDQVSSVNLVEGSAELFAGGDNEGQIPRIDTEDATVYLNAGARVRVNTDARRGTVVIGRAGTAEVRTRAGSFRVGAGEYLQVQGDQEPQIERGVFSRDRFDIWVADRLETATETRGASSRYVDSQYASDAVALDGYGDWQYNDEYDSNVWSPRVEAGWTPYSYGSWYYTPAGMTWWSFDPWGWFPFHYGSWFFSASWNRWCWRPASVYSPAWVYWGYTSSFVGWCPFGSYSYWSPWWNNYYRHAGWGSRSNVFIPINGVFSARSVDFRGWNFVGAHNFGTTLSRMDVIPGARIADRLGTAQVAISSRPMVVNARPGQAREAVQNFVREAPRVVARGASAADSANLAPILARQRTLPQATLDAVQQRAVVTERGRLAGASAAEVAPRGALVDRNRTFAQTERAPAGGLDRGSGRETRGVSSGVSRGPLPEERSVARPESDWRSRSLEPRTRESAQPEIARPSRSDRRSAERPAGRTIERARPDREMAQPPSDWRSRSRSMTSDSAVPPATRSEAPRGERWRSRPDMPPARRVIEGAVPGRRASEAAPEDLPRARTWRSPERGDAARAPRPEFRSPERDYRSEAPPPRAERAPAYSAPPPRMERPPAYSAPAPPRAESHRSSPPPPPSSNRERRDR